MILKLPWRIAPLESHRRALADRALAILRSDSRAWIVGGHSRGGALAARFAGEHAGELDGLLLLGTSHPREQDLSRLTLQVTKVYGSEDGLASESEIHEFAPLLPASTRFVRIAGGNHAQFGWYGRQIGDGAATISRMSQHEQVLEAVLQALDRVAEAR